LAQDDNPRDDDTRSPAQRRAEALADVCGFYVDYRTHIDTDPDADAPKVPKKRNWPHHVAVATTGDIAHHAGAQLLNGPHIDHRAFEALSCTAQLLRLVLDEDGAIRSYQMLPATVTDALFQAIAARDQGCRWPGCHKKPIHCDVHHLHHQENGGVNSPSCAAPPQRTGGSAAERSCVTPWNRRNPAHHLCRRIDRNNQTPNPTTRPPVELTKSLSIARSSAEHSTDRPSDLRENATTTPHSFGRVAPMRVFLAGASGVIGMRLIPLLAAEGRQVTAMTRSHRKADTLRDLGADPIVCDVFDTSALCEAVKAAGPDIIMNQITDLPDTVDRIGEYGVANARIRREGTQNLLAAARAAGVTRFITQSVAWTIPGDGGAAVEDMERSVLSIGGTIIRYGQFYGDGTYYEEPPRLGPIVHVDTAARRTLVALATDVALLTVVD
jgi:hypothetical protein